MDAFYLLFSGGQLAGLGSVSEADQGALAPLAAALLAPEAAGGRVEIWRGGELVEVVGAPALDPGWAR